MNSIETVKRLSNRNYTLLEPYIRYVRFPHYKQLFDGERIDFEFPLTVLVGPNGCNKSSVLQALYGCARGKSTGSYWFSTDVDVINEEAGRHCCIHGYYAQSAGTVVEVLKTRIRKEANPDYWETSRPIVEYGMERMPELQSEDSKTDRSDTRWRSIKKKVLYLDFRSEIGAYDKYFWHGDLHKTQTVNSKQDYIRNKSKLLRTVIDNDLDSYDYYNINRIRRNIELSPEACEEVSNILGHKYDSVRIIEHSFYGGQFGKTVILDRTDLEYSEAFAGSGETSVAVLVHEIMKAPEKSLILLDEPETSLHPKAQQRLQGFLLNQIIRKKHQIVISTHSPAIIHNLPQEAIKVMYVDSADNKIRILPKSFPEEAFNVIGNTEADKLKIYVEDSLTKAFVEVYIQRFKPQLMTSISVEIIPGGAKTIMKDFVSGSAIKGETNVVYIFDGDQKMQNQKVNNKGMRDKLGLYIKNDEIDTNNIPKVENKYLYDMVKELVGCEIRLYLDGNASAGGNEEQKYRQLRDFINYWSNFVYYFPGLKPEELLYDSLSTNDRQVYFGDLVIDGLDWKKYFAEKTKSDLAIQNPRSEEILIVQRQIIAKFPENCATFDLIRSIVENHFAQ